MGKNKSIENVLEKATKSLGRELSNNINREAPN